MVFDLVSALLRVDNVAPVEVAAAQTLHKHLSRGGVGSEGDLILVAQALDLVDIVKAFGVCGVAEEQHEVDLVEGDARAYLLRAALIRMEVQRDGSPVASETSLPVTWVAHRECSANMPQYAMQN